MSEQTSDASTGEARKISPLVKNLLEFGPVVLFFVPSADSRVWRIFTHREYSVTRAHWPALWDNRKTTT